MLLPSLLSTDLPIAVTTTERELTAKQVGAKVPSKNIRFYSQIGPIGALPFGQVWRGEIRGVPGKEKKKIEAAVRDLSGRSISLNYCDTDFFLVVYILTGRFFLGVGCTKVYHILSHCLSV